MSSILNYFTGAGRLTTSPELRQEIERKGIKWAYADDFDSSDYDNYFCVLEAVLNQEVQKGRITADQFRQIAETHISFSKQLVQYEIPSPEGDKQKVCVAFEDIKGYFARRALSALVAKARVGGHYSVAIPEPGEGVERGDPKGPKPLERNSPASKKLTREFSSVRHTILPKMLAQMPQDREKRSKVVKRVVHAELITRRMRQEIRGLSQALSEQLERLRQMEQTEEVQRHVAALTAEARELGALGQQVEELDVYALCIALSALPVGSYGYLELNGAKERVFAQVSEDLKKLTSRWLPFGKKSLNAQDLSYIQSVAGLLYRERGAYHGYCEEQKMRPEREGLIHLVLSEAIRVADGGEFSKTQVEKASVLAGCLEPVKQLLVHTLDEADRSARVEADFPPDTNGYAGAYEEQLRLELTQYYNQITWEGGPPPPRQHPIFNEGNGMIAGGIGGAIALAQHYDIPVVRTALDLGGGIIANPRGALDHSMAVLGLVGQGPQMVRQLPTVALSGMVVALPIMYMTGMGPTDLYQLAGANPQYTVALLSTVHAVGKTAYDYICPEERPTGLHSTAVRKFNKKRAVRVLGGATLTLMAAMQLYQYCQGDAGADYTHYAVDTVAGAVDGVWNHFFLAQLLLYAGQHIGTQVQHVVPSPVRAVASKVGGVVRNVASIASVYHVGSGLVHGIKGWFGAGPTPVADPIIEQLN